MNGQSIIYSRLQTLQPLATNGNETPEEYRYDYKGCGNPSHILSPTTGVCHTSHITHHLPHGSHARTSRTSSQSRTRQPNLRFHFSPGYTPPLPPDPTSTAHRKPVNGGFVTGLLVGRNVVVIVLFQYTWIIDIFPPTFHLNRGTDSSESSLCFHA